MDIAKYIDHTILKADANIEEVTKLCDEARQFGFAAVCVNPSYVDRAHKLLRGSPVKVCSVVGFPLGANRTDTKVQEARLAVAAGAEEIDMVIDIGAMKSGDYYFAKEEIQAVRIAVPRPVILKVIIESAALNDTEIKWASLTCINQGVDFVKTSTGFYNPPHGGAKLEHVKLIKDTIGNHAQIKASGGIKTLGQVKEFIEAGASRIGTSSGVIIMKEVEIANSK